MSAEPGRLADYLFHILAAIERIRRYTPAMDARQLAENPLVQDAAFAGSICAGSGGAGGLQTQ